MREPLRHFNSIKVQLEQMHLNTQLKCILLFQFHKGTIRTFQTVSEFIDELLHFNSIKVQLEQEGHRLLL